MLLDLVDDPDLIREYEDYHKKIWPEVVERMTEAGVLSMKIYRYRNRLSMNMEVDDSFTFERMDEINSSSETVQKWEELMWKYQQAIPGTPSGQKWVLADQIFDSTDFIAK
jgi:L-rhamnose mutarotase